MRPAPRSRLPALIGLGLAAVLLLIMLSAIALSGGSGRSSTTLGGREQTVELLGGIPQDGATLGRKGAPVSIGVFLDLQCSSCARYALRTLPPLVNDLVRSGRARLVLHHFSLGAHQLNVAAIAAAAAGRQGRQWQYAYLFMRNIRRVPTQGVSNAFLHRVARAVPDLDVGDWSRDRDRADIEAQLKADDALGVSLRLPAEPAVTVSAGSRSRKLTESPSAARVEAAVRAVGGAG